MDIYHNPGMIQNEIADRNAEASGTRRARLPDLILAGLIREERMIESRQTIRYYVTPEGERICRLLMEIEGESSRSCPSTADNLPELEKA